MDYVLVEAWRGVRQNYSKGTGVDKVKFSDIDKYGIHKFLSELQTELRTNTYQCSAVRKVEIPKEKKGEYRILGIPTIKDRVVQMVVKMLIEPMWEADFIDTSYGFRPKRGAKDAIKQMSNGKLIKSMAGTPQGGVISPLLSNIYLHAFDRIIINPKGKFAKANIGIVRYGDDLVLMGNYYYSKGILKYLETLMKRMGLTIVK